MLTGQNTEVWHEEAAFHVQTEDKGVDNPLVESLVYLGGRVLASKRTSYSDLLGEESSEAAVAGLMERQHQTMIDAIHRGQFDDQLRELSRETLVEADGRAASIDLSSFDWESSGERLFEIREPSAEEPADGPAGPPAPAANAAETQPPKKSLDEMVLDYLVSRQRGVTLRLAMEEEAPLVCGAHAELAFLASVRPGDEPVADAEIQVRVVSSLSPPRILAESRTDAEGRARFAVDIPDVGRGSAALIVSAQSSCGSAELKYLL